MVTLRASGARPGPVGAVEPGARLVGPRGKPTPASLVTDGVTTSPPPTASPRLNSATIRSCNANSSLTAPSR